MIKSSLRSEGSTHHLYNIAIKLYFYKVHDGVMLFCHAKSTMIKPSLHSGICKFTHKIYHKNALFDFHVKFLSFCEFLLTHWQRGVEPLYPNRSRCWLYTVVSHGKPLREKKKKRKLKDPLILLFFLVFSKCRRNDVWVKWRPCYFLVVWGGYKNIYSILYTLSLKSERVE